MVAELCVPEEEAVAVLGATAGALEEEFGVLGVAATDEDGARVAEGAGVPVVNVTFLTTLRT